jgi:hypothetical protein
MYTFLKHTPETSFVPLATSMLTWMKLYVAVSYLNRSEWAGDTAWAAARNGFELCLRQFFKDEGGDTIAAHAALYFEDVDDEASTMVAPFFLNQTRVSRSFFVDVLADGNHTVSVFDDPGGWYRRWNEVRVELFPVTETFKGKPMDVKSALDASLAYVRDNRGYDCYQNCNSICPIWPARCSPTFGCCCPCSNGTNCIEAVLVALAAGYGVAEWQTGSFLGLKWKTSIGARLPSELRDELLYLGVVGSLKKVLENNPSAAAAMPLLLIRD